MKTCYNTIDIVFNILKKKKKKKQWSTRDRIDLPSRSTSVPFRIPFNSYLANIDDPGSGWSTRATAYRCTQCNRPHTHARTKGYPHGRMSRARKCSTLHGMHFCDCYQTLGRCSSVWNVDSYPEPYILYTHALFLSLSLSSFFLFFPPTNVSFSVLGRDLVSRRPSVKFCRVRFWGFSIHRVTEPLKTLVYRFVDRKMFDQPRRSDSWKREIKWNSLFVREITSTVKYLSFSGWRETWRIF